MSSINVNTFQVDALVLSSERPEPIPLQSGALGFPINPMMFPHDWSLSFSVKTTWQTDLVKSLSLHTDASVLQSRPMRTVTSRFVGGSRRESDAIINSLKSAAGAFGFPVPIFSDAAQIESSVGLTLYGKFEHRRFFPGGRAIIMPLQVSPEQSSSSSFYVRIQDVSPGSMVVTLESFAQFRTITQTDVIIPCIDCQTLSNAQGRALTDTVFEAEVVWEEILGSSTLPGLWPAVSSEDASVLSPFCTIIDNKALFPFDPDWSDGVDVEVTREMDSDLLGRTQAQSQVGKPYFTFRLSLVGYDRKRAWDISRFFDAMRGRAGLFYLEHPLRPWTVTTNHNTFSCSVSASSNQDTLKDINEVILTLQGGKEVRFVDSVVETSPGVFRVYFTEPATDFRILDMQPVYTSRFKSDSLSSNWATDEVAVNMVVEIVEEARHNTLVRGDRVNMVGELSHSDTYVGFSAVEDNSLLLVPGAESYQSQWVRSEIWPATRSSVRWWLDTSLKTRSGNQSRSERRHQMKSISSPSTCWLVQPLSNFRNNNKACIMNPAFSLESQVDQSILLPRDSCLWSPTEGWTLFLVVTPYTLPSTPANMEVVGIETPEIDLTIHLDRAGAIGIRPSVRVDVAGVGVSVIQFGSDLSGRLLPSVICFHFGGSLNGNLTRVWTNGRRGSPSAAVAMPLPEPSSYSRSDWCKDLQASTTPSRASISDAWGQTPMLNSIVSYKRALTLQEVIDITNLISRSYFIDLDTPTLY